MKPLAIPDGKERVRPVKAVLTRWSVEGITIQEILDKSPGQLTIPEFFAYMHIRNVWDATAGSRIRQFATEAGRALMDGLEEGQVGPAFPVTLIDRLTELNDGSMQRTKEVRQEVTVLLPEGEPDGQPERQD